jgi:hypothetical protein
VGCRMLTDGSVQLLLRLIQDWCVRRALVECIAEIKKLKTASSLLFIEQINPVSVS